MVSNIPVSRWFRSRGKVAAELVELALLVRTGRERNVAYRLSEAQG